jgi:hypothetical protein
MSLASRLKKMEQEQDRKLKLYYDINNQFIIYPEDPPETKRQKLNYIKKIVATVDIDVLLNLIEVERLEINEAMDLLWKEHLDTIEPDQKVYYENIEKELQYEFVTTC